MKTKTKKFSHKLLALFMAVLMAATCFTGVMTSYAASSDISYVDGDVEYNDLAWNVLSDEQVATAVLDYADSVLPALKELEPTLADLVNNADIPVVSINYDLSAREITLKLGFIELATITVKLGSVDELLETINSIESVLEGGLVDTATSFGVDLEFLKGIELSAVNDMRRNNTSSCDIVRGVLGIIYDNVESVIDTLLRGEFDTGVIGLDVYQTIGDLVGGIDSGYESNFVYNLVQAVLFRYTEWFTDDEIAAYKAEPSTFVYDDVLLEKMTDELLDKINVRVTYNDGTNSKSRRAEIDAKMESGMTYEEAAKALGYDPYLIYSEENTGNILLFAYGDEKVQLTKSDSLFTFGYQALKFAWNTVLKDTVKLVHVNNDVDRGHGSNFDNQYYYWASENVGWSTDKVSSNYTAEKVEAWAEAVYEAYGATSAEEFLGWVHDDYVFDRSVADDAVGNWRDIDETTLFNKLRYSPLADYYFDMQTGPINLYFVQTGTPNLDAFFEGYSKYTSLVGGLNDCLVAAVKDIFVDSDNIYADAKGDKSLPTMATVNPTGSIGSEAVMSITTTLVSNALKVVQYVADTTDKNILNGFYKAYGDTEALSESNLETAMLPLLIACIGQINLSGYKLEDMIHPEDWDRCLDAEAVAFVVLREYLSYVLPNKDYNTLATITETKITADFTTCILPMARDAIIYVIEPYVPVRDADGNEWKAEGDTIDKTTSIFELLNSVLCYYADNYTYTNTSRSGENALGVASLLGVCDANGNSLVTMENDIWTNIDLIINNLLPVVGTLQGKGYGKADSQSLIMEDIVNGVLNIGDENSSTGLCGVSNFIYRLLTIVSAEPIQTTPVTQTVYNVVKDLLNGLFGPRYSGQEWTPVPDISSNQPWDDVLQHDVIAGPSENNPGVIGKAINNFVEFSGFGYNGVATYPDSILPGLTFAVTAVNSFTDMLPNISDHELDMGTVEITNLTYTGCTEGSTYTSTAVFTNNCEGVNVAYVDGMEDNVEQMSRYYLKITSATNVGSNDANASNKSSITGYSTDTLIAPGESVQLTTNSVFHADENSSTTCNVTITYSICDASGNVLHSGLTANAYQYLTSEKSWREIVYPDSRISDSGIYYFASDLESNNENTTKTVSGYNVKTTSKFASSSRLIASYPEYVVLSTDNLSEVNNFGVRVRNTTGTIGGGSASVDGLYYYDSKDVYNDATGTDVTVGVDNPIAAIDKETGDILQYGKLDISYDEGVTWDRTGYTQDESDEKLNELEASEVSKYRTRDHVAVTFAEAQAAGIVAAYHVNEKSGLYEYLYLQNGEENTIYRFDQLLGNISLRGPIDGFYVNSGKQTISKNSSSYFTYLTYDGKTDVSYTEVDTNLAFYSQNGTGTAPIHFVICDVENAATVKEKVIELQELMANYTEADFNDGETVFETAQAAIVSGLAAVGLPITPETAGKLSDEKELAFNTATSTSATGDKAYRPLTTSEYDELSAAVKKLIYIKTVGDEDYYYFDSSYVSPVYSTTPLTAEDVVDGKDAVGMPVTAVTVNGETTYYIANDVQYAKAWDTTTYSPYPYMASTGTQAADEDGNLLYDQVQWSYYNKNGYKVSSQSTWVVKMPDTSYQLVDIDAAKRDTRGLYTQNLDRLTYTTEYVLENINEAISQSLLTDVSLVRNGLNEKNFEIVTYNKMVDMAKTIESLYTVNVTYTVGGDATVYEDNLSFSSYNKLLADSNITIKSATVDSTLSSTQIGEYKRLFNFFLGEVVERGYLGDRLEDEISCASGNTYSNLTVSGITKDSNNYKDYTNASVSKTDASGTPEFGVFSSDGTLVNDGDVIYPDNLWTNYIQALARAVDIAQLGNGTYAYKAADNYDTSANYEACVTKVYDAKLDLQAAEIALENTSVVTINVPEGCTVTVNGTVYTKPLAVTTDDYVTIEATVDEGCTFEGFEIGTETVTDNPYSFKLESDVTITPIVESASSSDISVSGTVVIATDTTGTAYTTGIVGINILVGDEVVGTSAADGTFSVTVPAGTTELTFQGESTVDRTVTLSGTADVTDAVIPIVVCDYNRDLNFNATDTTVFSKAMTEYNVYCDLNGDSSVNPTDASVFSKFLGNKVDYEAIALD